MISKLNVSNSKGVTLLELLAVIVILGIISIIAIPSISNIIQKSKDQAFVANAYSMYEAATIHVRAQEAALNTPTYNDYKLTYKKLVEDDYLNAFQDPYTRNILLPKDNSFVLLKNDSGKITYSVCLKGETKNICTDGSGVEKAVPIEQISTEFILDNPSP